LSAVHPAASSRRCQLPRRASSSTAGAPLTFSREYFQGDRGLLGESHNLDWQGGQLLERHLEIGIVNNLEAWYALFDEDAVLEFPYAIGTPFPARLDGKTAIREHIDKVARLFGRFTFHAPRFHATGRDLASCEVHGVSTIAASGVAYEQNFVMIVEARDGRIADAAMAQRGIR
jgi:ketosteroid isomerase-like protein